ncbi:MAG: PDZ domain-containing protein [Planctomycetaceae bacterium]|nr:PDZ domain-containing protein [Planctomycetaceae bacterium]MCP4464779.1 PDZ domain-containing protein [Planctomycetaceae bacterium]
MALLSIFWLPSGVLAQNDATKRMTPLVKAVANARPAVVNLRGKKTLRSNINAGTRTQAVRQVNGMGTGVIIDPSGYILTNFHVVEDVERIQVTLAGGETTVGQLIAHDNKTDLALIKIDSDEVLPTIPLGTSSDVMLAETVAALGNAYGYEDTITRGIISEIGRTVQVSDEQIYHNLLQTDASINPGNSGGPLINLDGEMIGINVAVRVGAQGIAFAIPVNDAMEVAAGFLSEITQLSLDHGIIARTVYQDDQPTTRIQSVKDFSAAERAGLKYGDVVKCINGQDCERAVDLHRLMLDISPGSKLELEIERGDESQTVAVQLGATKPTGDVSIWSQFGIKVTAVGSSVIGSRHPNYSKGLRIDHVRPGGPADQEGLRRGDILVTMDGWKTESIENLMYVLKQEDVRRGDETVFYIIRNGEPFYGNIRIASN